MSLHVAITCGDFTGSDAVLFTLVSFITVGFVWKTVSKTAVNASEFTRYNLLESFMKLSYGLFTSYGRQHCL